MACETIEYTEVGARATIRLNRPERLNSVNEQMHSELAEALARVRRNPLLRCLVITGTGRAFSSGQDLAARYESLQAGEVPELSESLMRLYNPLITTIRALPIPVVCAVNGTAAGAAVGLALACDVVLAARSAKFIFSFVNVGLAPDAGCSASLSQALGNARARALLMLGETLSAEEACDLGMIWQCVDDASLALALCKELLNDAPGQSFATQLANEARCQGVAGRSPDYRESVLAFVEKRKVEKRKPDYQ